MTQVKICGLSTPQDVKTASQAGARFLGFVFFPKSPRHLQVETAAALCMDVPIGIAKVGLVVNPSDDDLSHVLSNVPLDMIQLHGSETPDRVAEIKSLTGLPVIKAVGVSDAGDLDQLWDYGLVADMLLVDAKPPKNADLPGGNGLAFDWRFLVGRKWLRPWMLAGGLTPKNVAEAVRLTGAPAVDVSSGVEHAPGRKDAALIRSFITAAG